MDNIIDFKAMVAKLQKIDPTSLGDIKKQIITEMKTSTPPTPEVPLSELRELAGLPTPEMSKKKIKKAHKTVDKMKDSPDAKKSIGKWAKGKFKDAKSAMYAIAMNQQKSKANSSKSFIGKALIDEPTTMSGKIEEQMREPNVVIEELKFANKFKVGDGIRAYDHQPIEGRSDKYIEGEVIAVDVKSKTQPDAEGYHVKVDKDTLFQKTSRVGKTVFVPYEIPMDYDERVSKVDAHLDYMNVPGREYDADDEEEARALAKKDKDDEARAWARSGESKDTNEGPEDLIIDLEQDLSDIENLATQITDADADTLQRYPDSNNDWAEQIKDLVQKIKLNLQPVENVKTEATGTFIGGHQGTADFEPPEDDQWHDMVMSDIAGMSERELVQYIAELYDRLDRAGALTSFDKKIEGKMSNIDLDLKQLSDKEFEKKYGKSKEELKKGLGEQNPEQGIAQKAQQLRGPMGGGSGSGQMVAKGLSKMAQGKDLPLNLQQALAPYAQALTKLMTNPQLFQKFKQIIQQAGGGVAEKRGVDPDVDVPKDHEYGPSSDKAPAGKRGYKSSPGARTAHLKTVKKWAKKKRRQGDKQISMDGKNKLLDIGKAIREKAQEQGLQPSAFLGYLVTKDPEKYGALEKLQNIIDGKDSE